MTGYQQKLGVKGEKLALQFLRSKGYEIISRNFSCRLGEIDIIARQGKATVFIEVKTRSCSDFGLPEDAIVKKKRRHLWRTAQFYIKNYAHQEDEFRFDLVAILWANKP